MGFRNGHVEIITPKEHSFSSYYDDTEYRSSPAMWKKRFESRKNSNFDELFTALIPFGTGAINRT